MRRAKKEKNRQEYLDLICRTSWSAERLYTRVRTDYLVKCNNYPYSKASEIATREWNKLMDKVENQKGNIF